MAASCRGSDIDDHLLLMLMMMEVSVTSVLLILGIFCSASWAQPGGDLAELAQCMEPVEQQCLRQLAASFPRNPQQMINQIATTDLSQTCEPLTTARDCVQRHMEECGVFAITHPDVVETIRYMRLANYALNYICRDHVDVFNEYKGCLLRMNGRYPVLMEEIENQCGHGERPTPGHFCIPREFAVCATNVVEEQCGGEIAMHLRDLGIELLEDIGCEPSKHFQKMKKEKRKIQSPLQLINEALSSLF